MKEKTKPGITEIVVVEGLHDAQRVREAVQADVWVIGGDRIAKKFLSELKRAQAGRGVVVLTDPDGPGERIRLRIQRAVPTVKHAFIPKSAAIQSGRVGVEFASPEVIRNALLSAKVAVTKEFPAPVFSVSDLLEAGLVGGMRAREKRERLGEILGIGSANAKGFLRKLNDLGVGKQEWAEALQVLENSGEGETDFD